MNTTRVVFCVSSGRSGTFSLYKALSILPGVEARHEPWCETVQQLGCLFHGRRRCTSHTASFLDNLHGAAVVYSKADYWFCIGNKESWVVLPLSKIFPKARFVWLVRDGRKVALSYYHKLSAESYDDEAVEVLADYLSFPAEFRPPPPDKRWWWPVPRDVSERSEFVRWDRWRRVCWYFNEVCRELKENMTATRMRVFRLEDMTKSPSEFLKMTVRMGLEDASPADMEMAWQTFRKPSNVHVPVNYQMTPDQEAVYRELCGEVHEWLGYGWEPVEDVKYDN